MKYSHPALFICILMTGISCSDKQSFQNQEESTVLPLPVCEPFSLKNVELLPGPFQRATDLNIQSLLNYDPDRLLSKFRKEAGLEPKAEHYLGWEEMTLAGHSLGHFLSGCALMYQTTGDPVFLKKVNYVVDELGTCQDANGNGYVGAFPDGMRILEEEVGKGDIRPAPFYLNGIWAPFYTIHKVMAGLRDAYRLCENSEALEIERRFADWVGGALAELTEEQIQEMLKCEHGGMNEVLADLYADTGEESYLELTERFHHREILDPLSEGVDILPGKHGNTQIPKLIGLARRYEVTGNPEDRRTAEYFWDRVVHHHSYVNGSHGYHEYFGPPDSLNNRLGSSTSESCNVYNMLKLSEHLFTWEASPEVADFYELALINHILSSQHPEDGRVLYFHSLQMGGHKDFQDPYAFTCCIGTGMENHSKYGQAIFYKSEDALYVNQFIAAQLNWEEKSVVLRQETRFPEEQGSRLIFQNEQPVKLTLQLRVPSWTDQRYAVRVNGRRVRKPATPGSYLTLRRTWKKGDEVEVSMPFPLKLVSMPDNPDRVAVLHGPLVLAGDLGPDEESTLRNPLYVPRLVTSERDPSTWMIPVKDAPNTFQTRSAGKPEDAILRPLYMIHDRNYTVYWDLLSDQDWQQLQQEIEERRKELEERERRTIDRIIPGPDFESQDHDFMAENPGIYDFNGQPFVESRRGWFSYEIRVDQGNTTGLMVEYWGGFRGPREFHIVVEGETLTTEDFSGLKPNELQEILYTIPARLTAERSVNVRFVSTEGHYAGPVFGLRTIEMGIKD